MMNSKTKKIIWSIQLAFLHIAVVVCAPVGAAEVAAEFRAGYGISDNVFLDPSNHVEDFAWTVGSSIDYVERSRRFSGEIRGVVDYIAYQDSFDPETVGALEANVEFQLVEDHLSWTVQDNFGQSLTDPLDRPTPANRQDLNIFTTGPNFNFDLGTKNFVGMEGRYSKYSYETSVDNNERLAGLMQVGRRVNSNTEVGLNVLRREVSFDDNTLFEDFKVNEAFLSYAVESARNIVDLQLGYTELELSEGMADGYLVRATWARNRTESEQLLITLGSEYSTQGDVFRLSQSNGRDLGGTADLEGDGVPFRSTYAYARYGIVGRRTAFSIDAEFLRDDFEYLEPTAAVPDREISDVGIHFTRDLTARTYLDFDVQRRHRNYANLDRTDDDWFVTATFRYEVSQALSVHFRYRYWDRESSNTLNNFTENRYSIGVTYIPAWGRRSI